MKAKDIISQFGRHSKDCGSPEVQVGALTTRILALKSNHFNLHKKDKHSHLGLVKMLGKRRRLLTYLKESDAKRYNDVMNHLGVL